MMMRLLTAALLFLLPGIGASAQGEATLPQRFSIQAGGGIALPAVDGSKGDFFHTHGNRAGYFLLTEGRYFFSPAFGLGLQYDYIRAAKLPDKAHVHYVHPNLVLRHLFGDGRQGVFFSLGIGYMDYEERTYRHSSRNERRTSVLFHQGYCGLSFALGYEFSLGRHLSACLRADVLTADWFTNPDARLFNPDPWYDDGVNHQWFKNNLTFFELGVTVGVGR